MQSDHSQKHTKLLAATTQPQREPKLWHIV
jgi:hypothetical protein